MRYKGIEFDLRMGAGANRWVWTAHTPRPKQGHVAGSRQTAASAAKRAIDHWCYQNPEHCDDAGQLASP